MFFQSTILLQINKPLKFSFCLSPYPQLIKVFFFFIRQSLLKLRIFLRRNNPWLRGKADNKCVKLCCGQKHLKIEGNIMTLRMYLLTNSLIVNTELKANKSSSICLESPFWNLVSAEWINYL